MKLKLTILTLLFTFSSFAQLTYKSGGKIYDENQKKLSNKEVRTLLANKPDLLKDYNDAITKKSSGSVLIGAGVGLAVGSFAAAYVGDARFPVGVIGVGIGLVAIGIPVRVGYSKKVKKVVADYNEQKGTTSNFDSENIQFIANANGVGLSITF